MPIVRYRKEIPEVFEHLFSLRQIGNFSNDNSPALSRTNGISRVVFHRFQEIIFVFQKIENDCFFWLYERNGHKARLTKRITLGLCIFHKRLNPKKKCFRVCSAPECFSKNTKPYGIPHVAKRTPRNIVIRETERERIFQNRSAKFVCIECF